LALRLLVGGRCSERSSPTPGRSPRVGAELVASAPRQPFGPTVSEAVQSAVTPTAADVMAARSIALELAAGSGDAPRGHDVLDAWLNRQYGLTLANATFEVRIEREGMEWVPPGPDSPGLLKHRGTAAVATALAQLVADGLLTRVEGNYYREDIERSVSVSHAGGSDNVTFRLNYPVVDLQADRWRPIVRYTDAVAMPTEVLDAAGLVAGPRRPHRAAHAGGESRQQLRDQRRRGARRPPPRHP
jgi:hypothetical protein